MGYEDYFTPEEPVSIEVEGLGEFLYVPASAGHMHEGIKHYTFVEGDRLRTDFGAMNDWKLRNVINAPFPKEYVQRALGVDKEFKELSAEDRVRMLRKLREPTMDELIKAIREADSPLGARSPSASAPEPRDSPSSQKDRRRSSQSS